MNESNWLCLDCGKNTLYSDDYYMLRNKLWRELVPREQRHRMLCLSCVSKRLGRPLQPEDFYSGGTKEADPAERPMDLDDYGVIDTLTPAALAAIDQGLISELTPSLPHKVARLVGNFMEHSPAAVPGLPDYFYLLRIEKMIESGVLVIIGEAEHLIKCDVQLG